MAPSRSASASPSTTGSAEVTRRIDRLFAQQYGVLALWQARQTGMTDEEIRWAHRSGRWFSPFRGAFQLRGTARSPEGDLLAACLVTGGQASHRSAAWWWRLMPTAPDLPTVTVARSTRHQREGMVVHRTTGQRFVRPLVRNMPCTDARRTMVDAAATAPREEVDRAVDRGLALRIFTVPELLAELDHLAGRRQPGAGMLLRSLQDRHCGAPQPSVLESMVLRLLARAGIRPLRCEQHVDVAGGRYRLDFVLMEGVALEVDGYFHHFTPEAHDHDRWRHNELTFGPGWKVLTYTWRQIVRDADEVLRQIRWALRREQDGLRPTR